MRFALFFLDNFKQLHKIYLTNQINVVKEISRQNKFTSLKKALKKPYVVYELDLYGKGLHTLPGDVENLVNLKRLVLSENNLKEFPNQICELSSITHLFLDRCNLSDIPDCISKLENLEVLWLMHNGKITLPDSIVKLKKLKSLNLAYNAISEEDLQKIKSMVPEGCRILYYH